MHATSTEKDIMSKDEIIARLRQELELLEQERDTALKKAERYEEMLYTNFRQTDTLDMLYTLWDRLPACNAMAVVGYAIQDLQYHQAVVDNVKRAVSGNDLEKVKHAVKGYTSENYIQTKST